MAGVQAGSAGRLSIEIVAEIARLQSDLDKAKRAVNAASQDIAKSAKHANDNLSSIGSGVSKFNPRQVTNLAFQFQDLGVQMAAAATSEHALRMGLMALVQQGPQIAMVMREANASFGDLAKQSGGWIAGMARAHPILAAVAGAAAVAGGSLAIVTSQMNDSRKGEIDAFTASLGLTEKELKKLGDVGVTVGDVFVGLWNYIKEGLELDALFSAIAKWASEAFDTALRWGKNAAAGIYAAFVGTYEGIKAVWPMLPRVIGEATIGAANLAIAAVEKLINANISALNTLTGYVNKVLGTSVSSIGQVSLGRIENQFAGAGSAAAGAFQSGYSKAFGQAQGWMDRQGSAIGNSIMKAMKDRVSKEAREKGLMDDDAAKKAGARAGKTAAEKMIEAFMASAKDLNALIARNLARDYDDMTGMVKAAMDKIDAANDNAFSDQLARDNAERTRGLVEAAEATAAWNERLTETIDYLSRIGGLAGGLGEAAGLLQGIASGNYAGIPGKAGAIVGLLNQTDGGRELLDGFQGILKDTFKGGGVFAETLSSVLQGAGTGAAVAGIVGNGSSGSQLGGMIGGALGQEFGKRAIGMVSTKLLSSLGAAAGPLGAIAGSILGSVVGGLFKGGPDWATTNLSSGASGGNKDQQRTGVSQAAGAFGDALKKIADTLGATVGDFQTSLGLHNGNWHVSSTGRTGVLRSSQAGTTDFKGDSQAALEFAIQDAISDGVFQGLSEGVQRLLKGEGDLDAKLQKAMSFQGVFDELEQLRDPQAYDLAGLYKWRSGMNAIFAEAGATADELAKLEELTGLKRLEITKKYQAETTDLEIEILSLQGKAEEALALSRQAELDAADASLRPLMERRNALLDEAQAAQTAAAALAEKAAADDRIIALQIRLSRAQGDEGTAKAIERMQELNQAQTEQERSMLRSIYAAEDLVDQQGKLTDGYAAQANALVAMMNRMKEASQGLRDFADELFGKNTIGDTEAMRRQVLGTMKLAGAGDQAAIAKLPDLISSYLPNAMKSSSSMVDYLREASFLGQGTRDLADVNDVRARYNGAEMLSFFQPDRDFTEELRSIRDALNEKLDKLNDTMAQGTDRQVAATGEVRDESKKTAKYLGRATNGGATQLVAAS